jgi:hypothetical protein
MGEKVNGEHRPFEIEIKIVGNEIGVEAHAIAKI